MIRVMYHDPDSGARETGGRELLDRWREHDRATVWIDLCDEPADDEAALLIDSFGLHPLAIQDAQRDRHPAKVEAFSTHTFVLLKGLDAETQDLDFGTIQIAIFVGARYLVTRHSGPSPSTDRTWRAAAREPGLLDSGPDAVAVRLSKYVVDRYLPILLALETRLEDLEEEMTRHPSDTLLAELVGHKANLKKMRRILTYHVQLFDRLKTATSPGIREELHHELTDVYEHLERIMSLTTLYYELASDLMDGYITLASHRLNHIVTLLTIVTTVFVPLSFLAGIYGMNFEHMPELGWRYGYFGLLGLMAAVAGTALYVLRRRGWLSQR